MLKTKKKLNATIGASSMTWTGRTVFLPALGAVMGKSICGSPVIIPPWLELIEDCYDLDVGEYPSCILLRRKLTDCGLIILTDTMKRNGWLYCEARKSFLRQGELL
ncbi:MAG: hypothetical protein KIY11_09815 [Thermoplasmata archaeon]|nr:hypothetical protein [Candidatus Sysuiplasma acidicola]